MARIRSIHPAIFTDEAFVSLSYPARMLWIGLWCEADDQGVFEWKPLSLKMKLAPVDALDVAALLEELRACELVRRFDAEGRSLGAVRNFCRYQRPRWPKPIHPTTPDILAFVAHDGEKNPGPMNFSRDLTAADRKRKQRELERDAQGQDQNSSQMSRDNVGHVTPDGEERRGAYSVPNGTAAAAAPPEPSAIIPARHEDPRTDLFRRGLFMVSALTGKPAGPARGLVGRWLKDARDDAKRVMRTIEDANDARPADPVAWIEGALRSRAVPKADDPGFMWARH